MSLLHTLRKIREFKRERNWMRNKNQKNLKMKFSSDAEMWPTMRFGVCESTRCARRCRYHYRLVSIVSVCNWTCNCFCHIWTSLELVCGYRLTPLQMSCNVNKLMIFFSLLTEPRRVSFVLLEGSCHRGAWSSHFKWILSVWLRALFANEISILWFTVISYD